MSPVGPFRARRTGLRAVLAALSLAVSFAACDVAAPPPTVPPAPSPAIDATAWAGAICESVDQLAQAYGDPESGRRSPAWQELETALTTRDESRIAPAANAVLGHLGQGARSANSALAFAPGLAAATEWWELHDLMMGGVRDLRDGTVNGDASRISNGRAQIQQAIEGHYEQGLGQMRAVPLPDGALPCG